MTQITDAKILIMSTNGFEQSELEVPLTALREAGATVHVATPEGMDITGWDDKNWGDTVKADVAIDDVTTEDYHALVLPGGQMNPDILRMNDRAVGIVREFHNADLENAGARWVDQQVAIDNAVITSRNPGDLEAFVAKIIEEVREGKHQRIAA